MRFGRSAPESERPTWEVVRPGVALDLWAAEDRAPVQETPVYLWARSPLELLRHLARLDAVSIAWALGSVRAADLYAPTLTAAPPAAVWVPDDLPPAAVAAALGGEVVDAGATLRLRQTSRDPWALHRVRVRQGQLQRVGRVQVPGSPPGSHRYAPGRRRRTGLSRARLGPGWGSRSRASRSCRRHVRTWKHCIDGRGRAPEVAEALRATLGVDAGEPADHSALLTHPALR